MKPGNELRPLRLAAMVVLVACHGSSRTSTITAVARDSDGRPVAGLYGRLIVDAADTTLQARTDSTGRIRWRVPAGGSAMVGFSRDSAGDHARWDWAALLLQPGTDRFDVVIDDTAAAPDLHPADPGTASARWGRILDQIRAVERRQFEAYEADVAAGREPDLRVPLGAWPDSLRRIATTDRNAEVRAAAWLALASTGFRGTGDDLPDTTYDAALRGIPPTSLVWARRPTDLRTISAMALMAEDAVETGEDGAAAPADAPGGVGTTGGEEVQAAAGRKALADHRADEYLRRVVEENPDSAARSWALEERLALAKNAGRQQDALALYQQLGERFPTSDAYRFASQAPPGVAINAGSRVPDIQFPPFAADGDSIPPSRFAGRVWLVDFWATWCVPCVAEMPSLHRAYRDFHDSGFDIVSVSFDAQRADVAAFRKEWPMPWVHSFAGPDSIFGSDLSRAYGVVGLPEAVLVGPDGSVIAIDKGLRGGELENTLRSVLGTHAR